MVANPFEFDSLAREMLDDVLCSHPSSLHNNRRTHYPDRLLSNFIQDYPSVCLFVGPFFLCFVVYLFALVFVAFQSDGRIKGMEGGDDILS